MAVDLASVGLSMPKFNFGLIGIFIIILIAFVVFAGLLALAIYLFIRAKQFKYRIHVFAKINNRFQRLIIDKARIMKINPFGDKVMYLSKSKRHLPMPVLQMGKNEFWYGLRGDGELINIDIEDLDEKAKRLNIHFVDTDMRMARIGLERHFQDIFKKTPEWKKLLMGLAIGVIIFIMVVSNILMFSQFGKLAEKFDKSAQSVSELAVSVGQVASGLKNSLDYTQGKNPSYLNKNSTTGLIPA